MRYVKQKLVFRLNEPLHPLKLDQINAEFSDLIVEGVYEQGEALAGERDEPDLAHLPRLIFSFSRRSFGRLRQLIDVING
jgi:hypothetical protein